MLAGMIGATRDRALPNCLGAWTSAARMRGIFPFQEILMEIDPSDSKPMGLKAGWKRLSYPWKDPAKWSSGISWRTGGQFQMVTIWDDDRLLQWWQQQCVCTALPMAAWHYTVAMTSNGSILSRWKAERNQYFISVTPSLSEIINECQIKSYKISSKILAKWAGTRHCSLCLVYYICVITNPNNNVGKIIILPMCNSVTPVLLPHHLHPWISCLWKHPVYHVTIIQVIYCLMNPKISPMSPMS